MRARVAECLCTEQSFRRIGGLSFGTLFALFLLWQIGDEGAFDWWLILVGVAYGAGWVWAFLMWHVMKRDSQRLKSQVEATRKATSGNNGTHST